MSRLGCPSRADRADPGRTATRNVRNRSRRSRRMTRHPEVEPTGANDLSFLIRPTSGDNSDGAANPRAPEISNGRYTTGCTQQALS